MGGRGRIAHRDVARRALRVAMAMGRSRGCSTSTNCITLWALPMPERVHASTRVKAVPPFQRLKAWRKLETSPLPRREAVSIRGRPPVARSLTYLNHQQAESAIVFIGMPPVAPPIYLAPVAAEHACFTGAVRNFGPRKEASARSQF
jgi:hypothetical protein